MAQTGRFLEM